MWVSSIPGNDKGQIARKVWIKGPNCTVGRAETSDLSFSVDKSVSRNHAQLALSIEQDQSTLKVIDAKSTYSTFVNQKKIEPNVPYVVRDGDLVRFGVNQAELSIRKQDVRICFSQLNKQEKNTVKRTMEAANIKVVTTVELSSHLVTNSITATVKTLVAVVLQLKIVTIDWLKFTDLPGSIIDIPDESAYFPPLGPKIVFADLSLSRLRLFEGLHFLIAHKNDDQYEFLLRTCSAFVTKLDNKSAAEITTAINNAPTTSASSSQLVVLFNDLSMDDYQDLASKLPPNIIGDVRYLSTRALANTILACQPPALKSSLQVGSKTGSGTASSQSQPMSLAPVINSARPTQQSQAIDAFPSSTQPEHASTPPQPLQPMVIPRASTSSKTAMEVVKEHIVAASAPVPATHQDSTVAMPPPPPVKRGAEEITSATSAPSKATISRRGRAIAEEKKDDDWDDPSKAASSTNKRQKGNDTAFVMPVPLPRSTVDSLRITDSAASKTNSRKRQGSPLPSSSEVMKSPVKRVKLGSTPVAEVDFVQPVAEIVSKIKSIVPTTRPKPVHPRDDEDETNRYVDDNEEDEYLVKKRKPNKTASRVVAIDDDAELGSIPANSEKAVISVVQQPPRRPAVSRDAHEDDDDSNWLTVEHGLKKLDLHRRPGRAELMPVEPTPQPSSSSNTTTTKKAGTSSKRGTRGARDDDDFENIAVDNHTKAENDNEYDWPIAEVIEREIPMRGRNYLYDDDSVLGSPHAGSCSSSGSSRDVRKFRKNYVRTADSDERISVKTMQKVLPKESEREIQMRLELENMAAQERDAEVMFAERANATKRGRR